MKEEKGVTLIENFVSLSLKIRIPNRIVNEKLIPVAIGRIYENLPIDKALNITNDEIRIMKKPSTTLQVKIRDKKPFI